MAGLPGRTLLPMSSDRPGKGLGMGLSALLGDSQRPQTEAGTENRGGVREIEITARLIKLLLETTRLAAQVERNR